MAFTDFKSIMQVQEAYEIIPFLKVYITLT